jgi:hypothetical protein
MSVSLTKEQIRSLYGVTGKKGEVVAYGRSSKHTNPGRTNRRQFTHDEMMKFKPALREVVVESEV